MSLDLHKRKVLSKKKWVFKTFIKGKLKGKSKKGSVILNKKDKNKDKRGKARSYKRKQNLPFFPYKRAKLTFFSLAYQSLIRKTLLEHAHKSHLTFRFGNIDLVPISDINQIDINVGFGNTVGL